MLFDCGRNFVTFSKEALDSHSRFVPEVLAQVHEVIAATLAEDIFAGEAREMRSIEHSVALKNGQINDGVADAGGNVCLV